MLAATDKAKWWSSEYPCARFLNYFKCILSNCRMEKKNKPEFRLNQTIGLLLKKHDTVLTKLPQQQATIYSIINAAP